MWTSLSNQVPKSKAVTPTPSGTTIQWNKSPFFFYFLPPGHLLISLFTIFFLFRQLKWIIKGVERLETLVSISTDGRVLEWNLKKGLVMSSLMQLKKTGMVNLPSTQPNNPAVLRLLIPRGDQLILLFFIYFLFYFNSIAIFSSRLVALTEYYVERGMDLQFCCRSLLRLPPTRLLYIHYRYRGRLPPPLLRLLQ